MLSLSWSSQFCNTDAGRSPKNAFQCQRNHFGLVVHGLWPQSAAARGSQDHPRNCKRTTTLAQNLLREHLCTMPGVQLMQDEWGKHGTCAFDSPAEYFGKIETVFHALQTPDMLQLAARPNLQAGDVVRAFVSANRGLRAEHIRIAVDGHRQLTEVRVCYKLDYSFGACKGGTAPDNLNISIAQ